MEYRTLYEKLVQSLTVNNKSIIKSEVSSPYLQNTMATYPVDTSFLSGFKFYNGTSLHPSNLPVISVRPTNLILLGMTSKTNMIRLKTHISSGTVKRSNKVLFEVDKTATLMRLHSEYHRPESLKTDISGCLYFHHNLL
jgi:hypothetical protein